MKNYKNKILLRKALLNLLLRYLLPTNSLVVYISQDLDKLISKSQKNIYLCYHKNMKRRKYVNNKSLQLRKIA